MDEKITEIELKRMQREKTLPPKFECATNPIRTKLLGFVQFKKKFGIKDMFTDV